MEEGRLLVVNLHGVEQLMDDVRYDEETLLPDHALLLHRHLHFTWIVAHICSQFSIFITFPNTIRLFMRRHHLEVGHRQVHECQFPNISARPCLNSDCELQKACTAHVMLSHFEVPHKRDCAGVGSAWSAKDLYSYMRRLQLQHSRLQALAIECEAHVYCAHIHSPCRILCIVLHQGNLASSDAIGPALLHAPHEMALTKPLERG